MYNNQYLNAYNSQMSIDRINAQLAELEQMKQRLQQPAQQPSINQTFQLTPTASTIKYASTIDEVSKEYVLTETPFFTKDFSQMWLKDAKGDIKTYTLEEIMPKDERDILIESLQLQVEQLRKEVRTNAKSNSNDDDESNSCEKSTNVSVLRTSSKKSK